MAGGENIERLSGGWKLSLWGSHDHRDIVAATGRRVVCLNKGRISNNVTQIPYCGQRNCERDRT